jgi:hypothetical protein
MAKNKKPAAEYDIGYKKPPVGRQFKPGKSGNPGGRKRRSLNLDTVVKAVMTGEIAVTDHNGQRLVSLVEALVLRQAQNALQGNSRSIESLLDRYGRCCDEPADGEDELPEEDAVMLEEILKRRARRRSSQESAEDSGE